MARRQGVDPTEVTQAEIDHAFSQGHAPPAVRDTGMVKPMEDAAMVLPAMAPPRDESQVLEKIKRLAAAAGTDWYYSFPVRDNATGQTKAIEGPSIKCANNVARIFGNCIADCRLGYETDESWVFYARFVDRESGFVLVRAFQQRKSQKAMKTKDPNRALDIVFQIGQSKAIRNVICNALETFADFAFEEAKYSLVERIGKNLDKSRAWIVEQVGKINVAMERVEAVRGRKVKEWLATDMALIYAELQAVNDGMALADELWPVKEPLVDGEAAKHQGSPPAAVAHPAATQATYELESAGQPPRTSAQAAPAPADDLEIPPGLKRPLAPAPVPAPAKAATPPPKAALASEDAPPADDQPRICPYQMPPLHWVEKLFVPLVRRMGSSKAIDALVKMNSQTIRFVDRQSPGAHRIVLEAVETHRTDLTEAAR